MSENEVLAGLDSAGGSEGDSVPGLSPRPGGFRSPWLSLACRSITPYLSPSPPGLPLCVSLPRMPAIEFRAKSRVISSHGPKLNCSPKDPFSKYGPIGKFWLHPSLGTTALPAPSRVCGAPEKAPPLTRGRGQVPSQTGGTGRGPDVLGGAEDATCRLVDKSSYWESAEGVEGGCLPGELPSSGMTHSFIPQTLPSAGCKGKYRRPCPGEPGKGPACTRGPSTFHGTLSAAQGAVQQ